MRRTALILAAGTAFILAPLGAAAPATAGSYTTQLCHHLQPNPPGPGSGWSTVVGGGAISSNATPAAWITECSHHRNNVGNWQGIGGAFGDTTAAGSHALARFIPPAGSTIAKVRGFLDIVITSGSYAEAGIFASSGRALIDNSRYLVNGEGISQRGDAAYGPDLLGPDGAQGILFGGRCPASLPPIAGGYCGGAGASFATLEITIEDPTPPVVDASLALDGAGRATLAWSASDPQSGLEQLSIARSGSAASPQPTSCSVATAPRCQSSASGGATVQLAEGETATYTVSAGSFGGNGFEVSKTVSVTRPISSAPTPQPPVTPTPTPPATSPTPTPGPTAPLAAAKVAFKTKPLKGRRVKLSGTAKGCKRVRVKVPGRKKKSTAKVKSGKWSVTVTRKRGTYRATCGATTAKRTVR